MTQETEQTEESRVRPWRWPLEWWVDEKFWRDVATRTVSGLIVLLIGYIIAVASGLFGIPDLKKVLAALLVYGIAILIWQPFGRTSIRIIRFIKRRVDPGWSRLLLLTSWGLFFIGCTLTLTVLVLNVAKWAYEGA